MTLNAATYATLWEVLVELRSEQFKLDVKPEHDKARICLRQATSRIDAELQEILFVPELQTRYFDARNIEDSGDVDVWELRLDMPLLSLTSVVNGDGTAITSDQYTLIPREGAPYRVIRLKSNGGVYWQENTTTGDPRDAISVTGVWAGSYRPVRGGAWYTSGDTVRDNPLTNSATTITVVDAQANDSLYGAPRFSPGMRLRITSANGTCYSDILNINDSGTALYVQRGAGGTTALQHAQGSVIEIWRPDENIVRACARLAAYYYRRAGRFAGTEIDLQTGTANKYADIPVDVASILALYKTTKARPSVRIGAI